MVYRLVYVPGELAFDRSEFVVCEYEHECDARERASRLNAWSQEGIPEGHEYIGSTYRVDIVD